MNCLRLVRRFCLLIPLATVMSCSSAAPSNRWVAWYIPNQPSGGSARPHGSKPCLTYVFANAPNQKTFVVATATGWNGRDIRGGPTSSVLPGEEFTGRLDLGRHTIHDDSTGRDLNVDVVYVTGPYLSAKSKADEYCPAPSAAAR